MRIIQTAQDIEVLKKANIYDSMFLDYLHSLLWGMYTNLADPGESFAEFSLQEHGPIYILEPGDNLLDLSLLGLNPQDKGLLGCHPESVEKGQIKDKTWYEVLVVLNNDYVITLFIDSLATDDPEIINWLNAAAGIG